jgi:hypothetical protein
MYILEVNHGGGEIHRHFLLPGQTYTLGRKECRILLPAAEPSISRHHATIVVAPMSRFDSLDPTAQLEVRIEDVSKHGTFVDRERVGKDNTRFLYPEDRIRLGLRVTARIIPMVLIFGISPDLTDESLDLVLDSAVHIGALVVEDVMPAPLQYYERHTNCVGFLYVAEDSFSMDETMMQALGYGYTLVTPSYVAHLVKCLEERDTLMPSEFPVPSSPSPASLGLRAVHYRRPAQTYFSVTEFLSIGRPIEATVFQGHTFLVLDGNLREVYKEVLKLFGGTMEFVAADGVAQWRSQHPQSGTYPLTTCVLVAEADFRAISEEVMERGGGRGDFDATHNKPQITGYLSLYKYGVCLIPEENVHLALYRNDAAELNTKATACYLQRTNEDVLADMTSAAPTPTSAAAPGTAAPVISAPATSAPPSEPASQRNSGSPAADADATVPAAAAAATATTVVSRRSSGGASASRVSESPVMPSHVSTTVIHLAPVQARRSREGSHLSAPSDNRAGSDGDKSSAATHASTNATSSGGANASSSLAAASRGSTSPEQQRGKEAASSFTAASPPILDAEKLASNSVAPSHLNPASSSSSMAAPDTNSVTTSITTTPPSAAATAAESTAAAAVASSSACNSNTSVGRGEPGSAAATSNITTTPVGSAEGGVQVVRSRRFGPRASHPFSLALRARNSGGNNSDDDEGEGQDAATVANGSAEVNGEEDEGAPATSTSQPRRATQLATRRASNSGCRPSLGAQPSPSIFPLKSEEVVRPRSRAASGSQQTAYAAAVAALGRKSAGHSEERPPFAPAEEAGQHLNTMEEAQRRSSSSVDLGSQGMPRLPPQTNASASSTTATATTTTTNTTAAAGAASAPLLQRAQPKAAASSTASTSSSVGLTTVTTTSPLLSEKVSSTTSSGAVPAHASVRRGEQRLASTSVPTPRRSVVRVNPALANAHVERSASPQQVSHARLKRFATPEREVVVHGAKQVSKSPPRQRVEAVRITNASVSHDPEASLPRHADPDEEPVTTGSMGNRCSVLRRESVSAVSRPPPAGGSVTRRASSSFHRSDSAQLREMATPHRLTTPRVSSSVPRRRSKAYGSVQRQRSPEPGADEISGAAGSAEGLGLNALANPGPLATAAQRAGIRRRRGSPTQGNGTSAGAAAAPATQAVPGQIPGLRGSSAAPVLGGTSNATAETYFRINDELNTHCQKFMKEFIDDFMSETERVTRSVVRQTYMDATSKETLEAGVERILEFLQYVNSTEPDIPSMYSTSNTRAACHQVRQKSQYTLSKIKACYKTVNCKIPSTLTRARAALSARNVSPPQRRLNSVAVVHEPGSVRRQSTF